MNLWNIKDLEQPPVNTYRVDSREIDIHAFAAVLREGLNIFKQQHCLEAECTILSCCIYRIKSKYRPNKIVKAMEKVNRCVLQYLQIDFRSTLQQFYELLPTSQTSDVYIPTRNNLQYILVRLQGIIGLFSRTVETTRNALNLLEQFPRVGYVWRLLLFCCSIMSRIWALSQNIVKLGCEFYRKLLPYERLLKNSGSDWLPELYELPSNLEDWVNAMWRVHDDKKSVIDRKLRIPIFEISDDSDDDDIICESSFKRCDDDVIILNEDDDSVVIFKEVMDDYLQVVGQYSGEPADVSQNLQPAQTHSIIELSDVIFEETMDDDLEVVGQYSGEPADVLQNSPSAQTCSVIELSDEDVGELVQHPEIISVDINESQSKKRKKRKNANNCVYNPFSIAASSAVSIADTAECDRTMVTSSVIELSDEDKDILVTSPVATHQRISKKRRRSDDVINCESSLSDDVIIVDDDDNIVIIEAAIGDDDLEDIVQSSGTPANVAQNFQTAEIIPVIELSDEDVEELIQRPEIINVESHEYTGQVFTIPVATQPQKASNQWRKWQPRRANKPWNNWLPRRANNQWWNWQPRIANNQWSNWQPGRANNQWWNWQPRIANNQWSNWLPQRANNQWSNWQPQRANYQWDHWHPRRANNQWRNWQPQTANTPWMNWQPRRANNHWRNSQPRTRNTPWMNWQPRRANNQWRHWQPRTANTPWINWQPRTANTPWMNWQPRRTNNQWRNWQPQRANNRWMNWPPRTAWWKSQKANKQRRKSSFTRPGLGNQNIVSDSPQNIDFKHPSNHGAETLGANFAEVGKQFQPACEAANLTQQATLAKNEEMKMMQASEASKETLHSEIVKQEDMISIVKHEPLDVKIKIESVKTE